MASRPRFTESVSDCSTSFKPKRASESKLVNWRNVGDEVDKEHLKKLPRMI